jgi:hypothetical protein
MHVQSGLIWRIRQPNHLTELIPDWLLNRTQYQHRYVTLGDETVSSTNTCMNSLKWYKPIGSQHQSLFGFGSDKYQLVSVFRNYQYDLFPVFTFAHWYSNEADFTQINHIDIRQSRFACESHVSINNHHMSH